MSEPRRVLVLGGYGLIGSGLVRAIIQRGHTVTGLGRDARTARRVLPGIAWVFHDLKDLQTPQAWAPVIAGFDVVVNAAGALQDGGGDDLSAVQEHAIVALAGAAAAAGVGLIQISAAGAAPDASTPFMATKGRADQAIARAGGAFWIFRPGLVIAGSAYGGTQMVRMLAAMPGVQPVAAADAPIQCVGLYDVAQAVLRAVQGELASGLICDLVEDTPQPLSRVVAAHRHWLGLGPMRLLRVPDWMLGGVARVGDGLGRLGWRSPLRSTAVRVLADGVLGDPAPWRRAGGAIAPLPQILARLAAGAEHRLAARMALALPLVLGVLAVFWLVSGVIGAWQVQAAAVPLVQAGWPAGLAKASVLFWAAIDVFLGLAILVRRWAAAACWGMIGVSLFYLAAASVVTPWMWLDPLGPLVKVLPAIALAALARVLLETR